jgi:hypothetical protein
MLSNSHDTRFDIICKLLMEIANNGEAEDAFRALESLGAMRERAAPAVPSLIRSLKFPRHRWLKCSALGNIGPVAIKAEIALIRLIRKLPKELRIGSEPYDYAFQALGRIHSIKATPIYFEALDWASKQESEPGSDSLVVEAFMHLRDHGVITKLVPEISILLKDPKRKNRKLIKRVLSI